MNFTKDDLLKAFEQGERYDYRPTWASCFNKWYNQTFIDNMSSIKQFVALYPNQIKSVENDGTWDISDNNIYS